MILAYLQPLHLVRQPMRTEVHRRGEFGARSRARGVVQLHLARGAAHDAVDEETHGRDARLVAMISLHAPVGGTAALGAVGDRLAAHAGGQLGAWEDGRPGSRACGHRRAVKRRVWRVHACTRVGERGEGRHARVAIAIVRRTAHGWISDSGAARLVEAVEQWPLRPRPRRGRI